MPEPTAAFELIANSASESKGTASAEHLVSTVFKSTVVAVSVFATAPVFVVAAANEAKTAAAAESMDDAAFESTSAIRAFAASLELAAIIGLIGVAADVLTAITAAELVAPSELTAAFELTVTNAQESTVTTVSEIGAIAIALNPRLGAQRYNASPSYAASPQQLSFPPAFTRSRVVRRVPSSCGPWHFTLGTLAITVPTLSSSSTLMVIIASAPFLMPPLSP